MASLDVRKFLTCAAEFESSDPPHAEAYLTLASTAAKEGGDEEEQQLVTSRFVAFLRRHRRHEEATALIQKGVVPQQSQQISLKHLTVAREAIEELVACGQIADETDAEFKLTDHSWLESHGLQGIAAILMGDAGKRACQIVFQQTQTSARIT